MTPPCFFEKNRQRGGHFTQLAVIYHTVMFTDRQDLCTKSVVTNLLFFFFFFVFEEKI